MVKKGNIIICTLIDHSSKKDTMKKTKLEGEQYWSQRYRDNRTGWDLGIPSSPIRTYIDQLENKDLKILIPGAGNAYEAQYIYKKGFKKVYVLDISPIPLEQFKVRNPEFPDTQLLHEDFFFHRSSYDLIIEQTFFCSFPPLQGQRSKYAMKMVDLLKTGGKLVGVWFDIPIKEDMEKRPFGGDKDTYLSLISPHLKVDTFEKCYNSVPERMDKELFGIFVKE